MSKDKLFKKLMTANDYPYAIEVWADSVTFTKEQKKWIKSKLQNEEDVKMLDHIFQRVYGTGYNSCWDDYDVSDPLYFWVQTS